MESAIIWQVTFHVETQRRAVVAPVAGPVVKGLVQGGHLGEGELPVAELVQLAVLVPGVLGAVHLEGPHLLVVGLRVRAPVLVIKHLDVTGKWGKLRPNVPHRKPWRTVEYTKVRSGELGCWEAGWR